MTLLTRTDFREGVFERDNHRCVVCGAPAVDAHHILERRLFPDGGYYLANGASVCEEHHLACETTDISVEQIRDYCKITKPVLPPHLYDDQPYDKWGNPIMPNGQRLRGELFYDESVQKVLATKLSLFTEYVKYPRTHHAPWSPGMNDDDRILDSMESFVGRRVIVTEKMDGENTSLYYDYTHARSIDGRSHPSRDWVKAFWNSHIRFQIPPGWRICAENLYAEHSIPYDKLPSYLMGFSVWSDRNNCLGWDDSLEWFDLLDMNHVPVLFDGIYDEQAIRNIKLDSKTSEGYVIRLADEFSYKDFRRSVAKYVRKGHVQTTKHWMFGQPIKPNKLASS